jgi:hypothetical protein
MNRFLAMFSVLMVAMAFAAGCSKKKEEAKTDEPAAAPAVGSDPATAPAADPATPPAAPPAGDPAAAGGSGMNMTADQACDRTISMMEQMGTAVSSNKGNCDGMGDALQKWADENREFIAWGKAQDNDPALKKELEEKCTPKMTAVMEKVGAAMGGAQECAQNEKVKSALSALD